VISDESLTNPILRIQPGDLPTPPEAAARIIQACSQKDVDAHKLAKLVASDPVMTAEILRTVNSAFFGMSRKIHTAVHAVTILGNRALRNLALCLAVRDAVRPDSIPGFDLVGFWEDALRHAVGARFLEQTIGYDTEEAFTIGLLQDFGVLAMFFAMPEKAQHFEQLISVLPEKRREKEHELFGATHDSIGLMLAKTWALPTSLAIPIACHHSATRDSVPAEHLLPALLARCTDWIASVYSATDKKRALEHTRILIHDSFGLSMDTIEDILDRVPKGVEEAAASLGLRVKQQMGLDDVLRQANRTLVEENLSFQELTWQLERSLAEQERLSVELQQANDQLKRLAYYDPLTGLVNHRRFHDVFPTEITRHSRNAQPLSLIILDLDLFKMINDTYGHPFGDRVLETVAETIIQELRASDIKARIGGEEMAILLPDTDEKAAKDSAERVRKAIEDLGIDTPTEVVKITASFGVCTWTGRVKSREEILAVSRTMLDTADEALYKSKHKGRNCVTMKKIKKIQ